MSKHLGDYDASAAIYAKFTTYRPSTGAAFTLAGTPAVSVYKDDSVTQSTAGVTLAADFDGVTGLNHVTIDTSADGTFYSAGSHFEIVITAGTVDGVSVVGSCVASFSLRKDSALKPTTAGRTLDVSAGGEAGLDWANIGSPTTAVNLSATNIDVDQVVASVSGNVGGNVTGSVGSVAANGITASSIAADAIGASELAADAAAEIATAVRTELATELARVDVAISTRLASAGYTAPLDAAGVRSAVGLASANLDTQLSAIAGYIDTEVGAIYTRIGAPTGASIAADIAAVQADTDNIQTRLPAALVSGRMDASVGAMAADVLTASALASDAVTEIQSGLATAAALATVDTVVDGIKVTTDKLDETLTNSSDGYIFTAAALQDAPSGGGSAPTAAEIADAVWEEAIADHSGTSGSTAEALAAAGSSGDPWITALPGSYSAGQAGFILGTNLDAAVSSRASQSSVNTIDDFVDTEVAAIKAVTDKVDAMLQATSDAYEFTPDALQSALAAGDDAVLARLGTPAGASIAADIAAVKGDTVDIEADTQDIQSRLPAALVSGRMDSSVGAMEANTLTASALASDAVTEIQTGLATSSAVSAVASAVSTIDGKVDVIDAVVDAILDDTGTSGVVVAAASKSGYALSTAGVDAVLDEEIEAGYSLRECARIWNAVLAGKVSGMDLFSPAFRDLADTKDRVSATVDADGNRSAITIDEA